jgi:hypothetical protein
LSISQLDSPSTPQNELFAPHPHFRFVVDVNVGAVRAVIDEHEPVRALLDVGVLP